MRRRILLTALLGACGGGATSETTASAEVSVGGEAGPTEVDAAQGEPGDGEQVSVLVGDREQFGMVGVLRQTPEEEDAAARRREEQRALAEAEYQARCANVALTPGLPPQPPASTDAALDALRPAYEASLASPPQPPSDLSMQAVNAWSQTTFSSWTRESVARLRFFEEQIAQTSGTTRSLALGWLAHAYAVFVEHFHQLPIPTEIAAESELRHIYLTALAQSSEPLLQQVRTYSAGLAEGAAPPAWLGWQQQLLTWTTQESCALH